MKTYVLSAIVCCLSLTFSAAKIINGYDENIESALASLEHLNRLPQEKSVLTRIERVREFILYHGLTKILLERFRLISAELYQQIDTICDYHGRRVDVHVKFVSASSIQAGTIANTNINQQTGDEHGYFSRYGPNTVAVEIIVVKQSLRVLAHEFGHISYQVPNLSSYIRFFKRNYTDVHMRANYLGHKPNDPSGQRAQLFEQLFRKHLIKFEMSDGNKVMNPLDLREQLRADLALKAKAL